MTTDQMADQVANVPLNYCPEAFASHLNTVTHYPWPEGSTNEDVRAAEHEIMRALIQVADAYAADDMARYCALFAQLLPTVPAALEPALYFEAIAAQMALPIWDRYTAEQRERGYRYAARYVSSRLKRRMEPKSRRNVGPTPEEEPWSWDTLPRGARHAYMDVVVGKFQLRTWLTQTQAYLATHPGDEGDCADLRDIMARWEDFQAPQAFF